MGKIIHISLVLSNTGKRKSHATKHDKIKTNPNTTHIKVLKL